MTYTFADRYEGITGSAIRQIFALLKDPEIISFAGGNPSPDTFPAAQLSKIAQRLIAERGASVLQYGNTAGTDALKMCIRDSFLPARPDSQDLPRIDPVGILDAV